MLARGRSCQLSRSSGGNNSGGGGGGNPKQAGQKAALQMVPMLDKFHDIIGGIHVPVDDGVDKLNRKYTLLVFLFLALPIFTKQYIGDPIECFAPVYFAEHQSRYINSYCWTQSTYYMVPVGDPEDDGDQRNGRNSFSNHMVERIIRRQFPEPRTTKPVSTQYYHSKTDTNHSPSPSPSLPSYHIITEQQEPPDRIMPDEVDYFIGFETVTHIGNERLRRVRVSYYQWAPLILLVQGLCFYIPFLIWNSCANNAGVKLRRLLKKASDIASLPPGCQQREALLAEFVDQFHTLVTGEAGWCADLQCGSVGSPTGSSASSQASGSSTQSGPQTGGGRGGGGGQTGGRGGGGGAQNDPQDQSGDGRGGRGGGGHHNKNSCCLVSIPIIGSLLACCLKPCSSFGLVGPSKYLCLLYLAVKSAYVFNVGLQFFLLGQFLGRGYLKHGLELINRLIVNGDWWASPRFPLSTLCQVRADMSGGLRSYTCQCVLPINVFNEKIFSVVWFYMAFLMPLNVLSLLFWIYRTFETNRMSYIKLCLWRTRLVELNQIQRTVRRLSQSYLGWDGVFLLRLIEHNHGSIMATLIMSRLWEFYANQMKLQEDQNQITLANNAQHTLSNTTTAISNQHQLLAAAAAAAAASNPQIGPGPGGGSGSHGHHGGQGHGHSHVPPLMPVQQHAPNQHFGGGGGGGAGGHGHGPGHGHGNPHPVGFSVPANQQQHGGGGQQQQQMHMGAHGPHAHHSGQISSQPGHHPLHAANTHHLHHHQGPPPHLGGPFANAASNASLLAQLQHQHSQQQAGVAGLSSAGQSHGPGAGTQQPASGNVAAAVAALAAAAAANSTNQSTPGTFTTTTTTSTSGSGSHQATSSSHNNGGSGNPGHLAGAPMGVSISQANQSAPTAQSMHHAHHHPLNSLHSLMLQQQQQQQHNSSSNATATTGGGGGGGPIATGNGPSAASKQQLQQTTSNALQSASLVAGQQQQQQPSSVATGSQSSSQQTTTTSFITASGANPTGPPLPPPPPAHVVAAVAAANSTGSGAGAGIAPVALAQVVLGCGGSAAPGMARTGGSGAAALGSRVAAASAQQAGQQPAPPSHTNPVLFNLKSSSIQAATNGTRYSPHTIKRT